MEKRNHLVNILILIRSGDKCLLMNSLMLDDQRVLNSLSSSFTFSATFETFNKKYTNLDDSQKNLLKEYINNITNTTKFKDYVSVELPKIVAELKTIKSKVEDKVTTIKLSETISVLEKMKIGKTVTDNNVSSIMLSYELIKELKSKVNVK